ncbi:MAG TPA: carbon-nitrogen hydrolase family protein [Gemmatimonadaceae bacterium]|jgi:predicted amidohydrolase|nr:carbon-nitrogen hydrolase family protein [Gemmatimonadaceae bacterium]
MSIVRIALANIPYPSSPDDSVARACRAIADAGAQSADLVCFPECYVPGYRADKREMPIDPAFYDAAWREVAGAARRANVGAILGTEREVDGGMRITTLVIDRDGSIAGFQDKVQLDPSEDAAYTSGSERRVFESGPLRFGISICHEGWRYPETVRWSARRGAHVVFHPHYHWAEPGSFRPTFFIDPANTFHEKAMLCRAAENTIYFASVNYASAGSPTTSAVIRPDGSVLAWHPYGSDGLLVADIDISAATGLLASRCRYPSSGAANEALATSRT